MYFIYNTGLSLSLFMIHVDTDEILQIILNNVHNTPLLNLLKPLLDLIKRLHRNGIEHGNLFLVIFVHEHHVEVLEMELVKKTKEQC